MFETWELAEPAESVIAPCRSIAITEAMRAEDRRRAAERERPSAAMEWRAKLQLDGANLNTVTFTTGTGPGRVPQTHVVVVTPRKCTWRGTRSCAAGCGSMVHPQTKGQLCKVCWNAAKRVAKLAKAELVKVSKQRHCACGSRISNRCMHLDRCGACHRARGKA